MKKKMNVLVILMVMVLIMNGCGKVDIDVETKGEAQDYADAGSKYTGCLGVALMDTGIYYQNIFAQLMYYDYETEQVTYVCSKPNCKHDRMDTECNANINGNDFPMVFRNERLYYVSAIVGDINIKLVLFSVKPDGSDRKEERLIGEVECSSMGYGIELYKQYAITSYGLTDEQTRIELLDTDTGEKSVLNERDGKLIDYYGLDIYYDYIYYSEVEYNKEGKKISQILYRQNLKTKKVNKVYEGMIDSLTFARGYIIFSDGKVISRMPLVGGKIEKLFSYPGSYVLSYDEQYLYIEHQYDYKAHDGDLPARCDDQWVKVMKLDGTEVDTIKWKNRGFCKFGDQNIFLVEIFNSSDDEGKIVNGTRILMRKSDIGGEHHFIDLGNGKPYKDE